MQNRLCKLQRRILTMALENRERELPPGEQRGADVLRCEILVGYYGFPAHTWYPWVSEDRPLRRRIDGGRCAQKMFDIETIGESRYVLSQNAVDTSLRRLEARGLLIRNGGDGCELTDEGVELARKVVTTPEDDGQSNKDGQHRIPGPDRWQRRYEDLVAFKHEYGHCRVPEHWEPSQQLANWVQVQRRQRRSGALSKVRIAKLDELGFVWDARDAYWEEMFAALTEYEEAHGDCNVPVTWCDNIQLANWVQTQRQAFRKGRLSAEREQRLTALGFEWDRRPALQRN